MTQRADPFERLSSLLGQIEVPAADPANLAHRPIFICGAPRSGTTLLYQALSFAGELSYVDNVIARFAACPAAGIALSQALDLEKKFTGKSRYGLTEELTEPHEFGRFWLNAFGLGDLLEPAAVTPVQAESGAAAIANVVNEFGQDTLFKSFAYLWFMPELMRAFPESRWIFVTRNEEANAASIARLYRDRGEPEWTSAVAGVTQREAAGQSLNERALAQCRDINALIARSLETLPAQRIYCLTLEELVAAPQEKLLQIGKALDFDVDIARSAEVAATLARS